jgi:hypothetical protein
LRIDELETMRAYLKVSEAAALLRVFPPRC